MSQTVLISIVDDDETMRDALGVLMRSLGFSVQAFSSAERFLKSPHVGRTACLIADVQMSGMTGPDLHQHLVSAGTPIPTIFITAFPEERVRERALHAGVLGYLTKPFTEDELMTCLRKGLGQLDHGRRSGGA